MEIEQNLFLVCILITLLEIQYGIKTYLEKNPNAKIMVWAATYHLLYNIESIQSKYYMNAKTAGGYLKSKLKNQYYCLPFTTYEGNYGAAKGLFSFKVKPSTKKSIEYHINNMTSSDCSYFSLRNELNINYIKQNGINTARLTGAKEKQVDLLKVCDALFFIRRMQGVNTIR